MTVTTMLRYGVGKKAEKIRNQNNNFIKEIELLSKIEVYFFRYFGQKLVKQELAVHVFM